MKRFFIILLCLSCAYPLIAQMNGRFIFKATETAAKGVSENRLIVARRLFEYKIPSSTIERTINSANHQVVFVRPAQPESLLKGFLKEIQKERLVFSTELRNRYQFGNISMLLPDNSNFNMPTPLKKTIKKEDAYNWSDWDKEWINLILQEIERVFPMRIDESEYDLDWVRIKVSHDGTVFEWSA